MTGALDSSIPASAYVSFSACAEEAPVRGSGAAERRPSWQEDTKSCSICHLRFGDVLNRRHHCRTCGKCVCHDCSPNSIQVAGSLERVCNQCVSNGAGALELLPALHYLRKELCSFHGSSSDFASLPPAKHPAQAVAECVAAIEPLRKTFAMMRDHVEPQGHGSVAAEVEAEQRERRARAWTDTYRSTVDARMVLSKELAQERMYRKKLEGKLAEVAEGLSQLDLMLHDLREAAHESKSAKLEAKPETCDADAGAGFEEVEQAPFKIQPSQHSKKTIEGLLASCTLSAGIWVRGLRKGSGSPASSLVPVLRRTHPEADRRLSIASTVTPTSSASASSESTDSSDEDSIGSGGLDAPRGDAKANSELFGATADTEMS